MTPETGSIRRVSISRDFDAWRSAARSLLARGVEPACVLWDDGSDATPLLALGAEHVAAASTEALAGDGPPVSGSERSRTDARAATVPAAFFDAARLVACHRDPGRWTLLYRIAWRLTHGE